MRSLQRGGTQQRQRRVLVSASRDMVTPSTGGAHERRRVTVHDLAAIAWNIPAAASMFACAILASGSMHDFTAAATWRSLAATLASSGTAAPAVQRCTMPRPSNAARMLVASVWARRFDFTACNTLIASYT